MSKLGIVSALAVAIAFSTVAYATSVEINFDNLNDGDVVTNQYAGVTFSSTQGNVNYVTNQPDYHSTPPNFLCSGPANGGIDCMEETFLKFDSPVNGLNFDGMGVNDVGVVGLIDVFTNGVFNSTVQVIGNAQGFDPDHIDLSAFANITEIRLYDITDEAGIGWDTFRYDQNVPEPGTMLMFGSGALGLVGILKRKMSR